MDSKEEGIILGRLQEFKDQSMARFAELEKKVDSLDRFKIKVTMVTAFVLGLVQLGLHILEIYSRG